MLAMFARSPEFAVSLIGVGTAILFYGLVWYWNAAPLTKWGKRRQAEEAERRREFYERFPGGRISPEYRQHLKDQGLHYGP